MLMKRILTLIIVGITLCSFIFLTYTGSLYFKTFILSHKMRISIRSVKVEQKDESFSVKIVFLLENPSELTLKATYVKVGIYRDSFFSNLLGESFKKSHTNFPGSYVILVNSFSNSTLPINVNVNELPNSFFVKFNMRVEDVPIVHALYITRHFSWKL